MDICDARLGDSYTNLPKCDCPEDYSRAAKLEIKAHFECRLLASNQSGPTISTTIYLPDFVQAKLLDSILSKPYIESPQWGTARL